MKISCEQFVFGESPDPTDTGFKIIGYSPGLTADELAVLEQSANVGEWLSRSAGQDPYYAFHTLSRDRVAFSIRLADATHRAGGPVAVPTHVLCHVYVLRRDELRHVGDPFALFDRDTPVRYRGNATTFGVLWTPANHAKRRLGELGVVELDVNPELQPISSGMATLRRRLLATMNEDELRRRCAVAYDRRLRGIRGVFRASPTQTLEDLVRFLWLGLPEEDRLSVEFSTHVIPIRWARYAFSNVPEVYEHELETSPPFEILTDDVIFDSTRPVAPDATLFANLIAAQSPLHAKLLADWSRQRRSWIDNRGALEPFLAKHGGTPLPPAKVPAAVRAALANGRLKPGEDADDHTVAIVNALKATSDRRISAELADVAVLLAEALEPARRDDFLRRTIEDIAPEARSVVVRRWVEAEAPARAWLRRSNSQLMRPSDVEASLQEPAFASVFLAQANASKKSPEDQRRLLMSAEFLIIRCNMTALEGLLRDWAFDAEALKSFVTSCLGVQAFTNRIGLLEIVFKAAVPLPDALAPMSDATYLDGLPVEALSAFLAAASSAVLSSEAQRTIAGRVLWRYLTIVTPTTVPTQTSLASPSKGPARAGSGHGLEVARATVSRLLSADGDGLVAQVIRSTPSRKGVVPDLWWRLIAESVLGPGTPLSCRAVLDLDDPTSLKHLAQAVLAAAAAKHTIQFPELTIAIVRRAGQHLPEWISSIDDQVQARAIARLLAGGVWPRADAASWCQRLIALAPSILPATIDVLPWQTLDDTYPGSCGEVAERCATRSVDHVHALLKTGVPAIMLIACRHRRGTSSRQQDKDWKARLANAAANARPFERALLTRHVK